MALEQFLNLLFTPTSGSVDIRARLLNLCDSLYFRLRHYQGSRAKSVWLLDVVPAFLKTVKSDHAQLTRRCADGDLRAFLGFDASMAGAEVRRHAHGRPSRFDERVAQMTIASRNEPAMMAV